MDITEHAHAAIISLTQYESANYHNDLDTARTRLLETMGHIVAIAKQTPGAPVRRPYDLGRPDRTCRYHRILSDLTGILPLPDWTPDPHNHLALAWLECVALCEHHGWMPLATLESMLPPLAQWKPERVAAPVAIKTNRLLQSRI